MQHLPKMSDAILHTSVPAETVNPKASSCDEEVRHSATLVPEQYCRMQHSPKTSDAILHTSVLGHHYEKTEHRKARPRKLLAGAVALSRVP